MAKLGELFTDKPIPGWDKTKDEVKTSIDALMEKGTVDQEILIIMKEMLDVCKPVSMDDYIRSVNDG